MPRRSEPTIGFIGGRSLDELHRMRDVQLARIKDYAVGAIGYRAVNLAKLYSRLAQIDYSISHLSEIEEAVLLEDRQGRNPPRIMTALDREIREQIESRRILTRSKLAV